MAYSSRFEGEFSCEDMIEEELDASSKLLHTKWEEARLIIDNQEKTISVLQMETRKLASIITVVEKENSKGGVTNKGKKGLMKKVISKEDIRGLQGLKIDKENTNKEERLTKISDKMSQHLTQDSELSHEHYVIKGKTDDQARCPPIFEQSTMIWKKKI
ncbi:unnamed protein product [Vicia faba]|uniref:Uncharacterized protein n=1 Tax=Vicia faba TaxID=3906 RepID=A0AAV1B2Y1_VICFA|nr:unnamed protein product [Vicia faba]